MNRSAAHTALVAEILALCGSRPDCRLWANSTGFARGLTHDGVIKFGLKGSADILGIGSRPNPLFRVAKEAFIHGSKCFFTSPDGRFHHELNSIRGTPGIPIGNPPRLSAFLAIEAKTGRGQQSAQQKAFQAMVEKFGGFYLVARSAKEVEEWLNKILG